MQFRTNADGGEIYYLSYFDHFAEKAECFHRAVIIEGFHNVICDKRQGTPSLDKFVISGHTQRQIKLKTGALWHLVGFFGTSIGDPDKHVTVFLGSTGVGAHLVGVFSLAGFKVAFSFRSSRGAADALVQDLTARGGSVAGFKCDVGFSGEVKLFYDEATELAGMKLAHRPEGIRTAGWGIAPTNALISRNNSTTLRKTHLKMKKARSMHRARQRGSDTLRTA